MSDEGMSDAAMTPDEIARAYLKSAIENKQAQFDKCTREVSAFMAADDVNLATFTRRWESARVEAETTLRVYETLRDIVANGDEYREQHENLLSVRQSDLTALTARLDTLTATLATVTAERDALREALRNPPKHVYWGAGEPDCPRDILASNGELHTLRCKVCGKGLSDGRICLAGIVK